MKARIKFSKTGSMRFIGHLDVMRYFQKAFRRAGIKNTYSRGFSPHPLMSFTSPLGVGLGSDAEYLDIELEESGNPEVLAERLNAVMNDEIRVKSFTFISGDSKPSMSLLTACDYLVALKPGYASGLADKRFLKEQLNSFIMRDKIEVVKKTKKSEKLIDIRGCIYHISDNIKDFEQMTGVHYGELCIGKEYTPVLYCQLAAGSVSNIKPELVLGALCSCSGIKYDEPAYQMHRLEMYADGDNGRVPLGIVTK